MRRTATLTAVLTLVTAMISLVGASPAPALVLPPQFTTVDHPTGQAPFQLVDFAWLEDGALLTAGKNGTVTFVPPAGSPRVLTVVPSVRARGDHGMLGFALGNDYTTTGRVYLAYDRRLSTGSGVGMVEEWKASPPSNPTSFTRTKTLIDGNLTSPKLVQLTYVHGIDGLAVAPDDTLYLSIGDDALNNGDPKRLRAQDLDQPHGKLLRLAPDGKGVASNPFYSSKTPSSWRSRIYASGFRNPFRFSLDPRTGLPLVGDVGLDAVEEINAVKPGMNGGWPCYEGRQQTTFATQPVCASLYAAGTAQPPVWTYDHGDSGAAVVGGMIYTGTSYPAEYHDSYFFGDYTRSQLWTIGIDTAGQLTRAAEVDGFAAEAGGPVAFHPGPNGDVTYADLYTSQVRRLVHVAGNRAPVARFSTTTDAATGTVSFSAADSYDLDADLLTYAWDFGDGTEGEGASVAHTYTDPAVDTSQVTLTVTDQIGAIGTTTEPVYPFDHTPEVQLTAPSARTYAVGELVELSATATDVEDGDLPVTWDTALVHCPFAGSCHRHPEGTETGPTYSHDFTDHGADTTMLVTARTQDSRGNEGSTTFEAKPTLRTLAVTSPVAVTINGRNTSSAQVVAGASVQLDAPLASAHWRFQSWSDGGAAAHSLTMPDADTTLTAQYATAIALRYAALGGTSSFLGSPQGEEYAVKGGRARNYSGGRMYWSPTYDAHALKGPILTKYLAAGGPTSVGLPTTDVVSVTGGAYAHFSGNRSIFWSTPTRARLVKGTIRTKYAAMGYQKSCLGFPTTDRYNVTGGYRNRFTGGSITYLTKTKSTTAKC